MDVGIALPQMAAGLNRGRVVEWCRRVDTGPFSSVSAGERIAFDNLEGITLLSAAASLTERVRVQMNVAVLPWHAPALIAKQLATIDVLSGGRLDVAVGIGGREQDYRALRSRFVDRHQRLDDAVIEVRRIWRGEALSGAGEVGPRPFQQGGPRVLASAMGPRSMARAARWADGLSGFTLLGDAAPSDQLFGSARNAWTTAQRTDAPRCVTGSFVALGADAEPTLRSFVHRYLEMMSPEFATAVANAVTLFTSERLRDVLAAHAEVGCDEFIIVPATSDPAMLDEVAAVVEAL